MPSSSTVMRPTAPSISSSVVRARPEPSVPTWVRVGGVADELDGLVGLALDAGDQLAGVGGGLGGALGQLADLVGDDGEALAALTGAGGLDRGVEREQVGLAGDVLDRLDDAADLLASGRRAR